MFFDPLPFFGRGSFLAELGTSHGLERLLDSVADDESRRRDLVSRHEFLGEHLGPLEGGGGAGRADDRPFTATECVCKSFFKKGFRSDDRQIDTLALDERQSLSRIGERQGDTPGFGGDPGVARGGKDLGHVRIAAKPPGKGVFPPPTAEHQDFHGEILAKDVRFPANRQILVSKS